MTQPGHASHPLSPSCQNNLDIGQQDSRTSTSLSSAASHVELCASTVGLSLPGGRGRQSIGQSVRHGPHRDYSDVSDEPVESPWARKAALSFDGGGVRGYSSLLILKELMRKIQNIETESGFQSSSEYPWGPPAIMGPPAPDNNGSREGRTDNFYPCHYFDYIIGTSTGGLSAIMLGRLRMTVDEALDHYRTFGNQVFGKARWWHERSILYCPRAKFSSKRARIAIKKVILAKLQQDNPKADYLHAATEQFRSPSDQTRTIVFAFCKDRDEGADGIHLWRTYDHEKPIGRKGSYGFGHKNPSKAHSETIWEVARSTSAAPMYFESIKLGNREFFDGGLGANNPAYYGLQEILQKDIRPPSFFLSIGTGLKPKQPSKKKKRSIAREILSDHGSRKQFVRKYFGLGRMAKGSLVDTEPIVGDWSGTCEQTGTDHWRFNVPTGLGAVPLDDWDPPKSGDETLDKITKLTDAYLATPKAQDTLDLCARQLVGVRHRRARTERWEVFGTDVEYYCPSPGCKGKDAYHYKKRKKLRTHCENTHADVLGDCLENLEAFLDAGRMSRRHVKRTCESDWRESAEKGFGNTEVLTVGNIDGEAEDGVEVETAVSRANGSGSDTSAANGANRVVAATGAVGGAEIAKASNGTATETDDGATNVPTIWIANETSNATTNRIPNTTGPATVMVVG